MRRILLGAAIAAVSMTINAQMTAPPAGAAPDAKPAPGSSMMTPEQQKAHRDKMATMKDADCGKNMDEMHGKSMEEMQAQMHEKMAAKDDKPGAMGAGKGGCGMMKPAKK
ncbi:MAG TPA: hypothetical protein VF348_03265 [Usitatibacter sp.]